MNEYNLSDVEVVIIKRDKTTGQVLQFRFPNVGNINISTDLSPTEYWDNGYCSYQLQPIVRSMNFDGIALRDEEEGLIMEVREVVPAKRKRNK